MNSAPFIKTVGLVVSLLVIVSFNINSKNNNNKLVAEPTYQLAFANLGPLNTDIFIANADGSNPHPLLAHPALDYNASFSQDANWVVFTSERNGSADIYRVHLNGSGLEQLTNDPSFDDQATLSPNGKSLAFVSSRNGQADIYILEIATKKLRNI